MSHVTNLIHGMRYTPEYRAWTALKGRCLNPSNKDFARWGGAGITVHPSWKRSFMVFYKYVGRRPKGMMLDRIDTRLGYVPGNVRWASPRKQAENRKNSWTVIIDGLSYPSVEAAARALKVTATTVVRWCDGYRDDRRGGELKPPRAGCQRWRTYR